jgi:hypothetical protein
MRTYPFDFLVGFQSGAIDGASNGDGSNGAGHDPSADGLSLRRSHGMKSRETWGQTMAGCSWSR